MTLEQILGYTDVAVCPIKEGEELLNSDYINCSKTGEKEVVAFCMQTSKLAGKPHKITMHLIEGTLRRKFESLFVHLLGYRAWNCTCTASGRCKLLHFCTYRQGVY